MVNVFTFSGNVGADAELRSLQSGDKVLNFRVANKVGFGDRATTQWIECSYFGKRGEAIANYVKKGDKVTVSGELKLDEFNRKDGTPGSKLSVRVNDMDLGSGPREGADHGPGAAGGRDAGSHQGGGYQNSGQRGGYQSGGGQRGGGPSFDEIPF